MIRIEVMRTLDLLLLIFQSNRNNEDADMAHIHKLYLERITLMFERLLIRPAKDRNCQNCCFWNSGEPESQIQINVAKQCYICFPVSPRDDLHSDAMDNPQRYIHLLEHSDLVEQDQFLIKGVASKFLILCSELCGLLHADYLEQTTRKKRARQLSFGHFEFKKDMSRYSQNIDLRKVVFDTHFIFISPQDQDYMMALFHLFDRNSEEYLGKYVERIYDCFIFDPTYAYSYTAKAGYPKSYLHLSFDDCSNLSIPDIYSLYAE